MNIMDPMKMLFGLRMRHAFEFPRANAKENIIGSGSATAVEGVGGNEAMLEKMSRVGEVSAEQADDGDEGNEAPSGETGSGMCTKFPSVKLRDCVTNTIQKLSHSLSFQCSLAPHHSSSMPYPIENFVNYD